MLADSDQLAVERWWVASQHRSVCHVDVATCDVCCPACATTVTGYASHHDACVTFNCTRACDCVDASAFCKQLIRAADLLLRQPMSFFSKIITGCFDWFFLFLSQLDEGNFVPPAFLIKKMFWQQQPNYTVRIIPIKEGNCFHNSYYFGKSSTSVTMHFHPSP